MVSALIVTAFLCFFMLTVAILEAGKAIAKAISESGAHEAEHTNAVREQAKSARDAAQAQLGLVTAVDRLGHQAKLAREAAESAAQAQLGLVTAVDRLREKGLN